jgi:hypothetical protein
MKRRTKGMHLGARKGGKGTGEGDRGGAVRRRSVLRCGGAAVREERKGGARGVEEALGHLL